jgi:hypothetical protein
MCGMIVTARTAIAIEATEIGTAIRAATGRAKVHAMCAATGRAASPDHAANRRRAANPACARPPAAALPATAGT